MVGLIVAICSGLGFLYVLSNRDLVRTDPVTLCPVDKPPAEVLAILVDVSDSFSEAQRLQVVNTIDRLRLTMPRHGLLEVYTLGDQSRGLVKPKISICNPGDGGGMNQLYQNPALAKKRWEQDFRTRVDALLADLINQPDSATSPIFEAVQSVALYSFGLAERDGVPRKLIVISDLLQHVPPTYSHYNANPKFSALRLLPYYTSVKADLSGTKVRLFYLERPTARQIQGTNHVLFWEAYFSDQGAVVEDVSQIFGAQ